MLRELRSHATALKNPGSLRWNPVSKRYAATTSSKDDDEDEDAEVPAAPESGAGVGSSSIQPSTRIKLPTKDNPVLVAIYGQICLAARSYQSAICASHVIFFLGYQVFNLYIVGTVYLLHAYDYCPEDPLVCLCLAIASIGRAMQRQADNRHHLITQGMGFLTRYKALRGEDTDDMMDEIEYNFGRAFHQLGMCIHDSTDTSMEK